MATVRYVALNTVRARLATKVQDRRWSRVAAHLEGEDHRVVRVRPVLEHTEPFRALIDGHANDPAFGALRAAETTGRPLGSAPFIAGLERGFGRPVAPSSSPQVEPTLRRPTRTASSK